MDYEQKYKDALERAKNLIALYPQDAPGYREVFPELAESEDERIRKHLIEIVETYWGKTNEPGKAADLAWLEKQKEQKPADLSDMMVHKEPYIAPVPTPMVADEQKPAEWSEEDEEMLQSIIKDFRAGKVSTIGQEQWLKSLRPSWKPSEEQMEAFKKYMEEFQARAEAAKEEEL